MSTLRPLALFLARFGIVTADAYEMLFSFSGPSQPVLGLSLIVETRGVKEQNKKHVKKARGGEGGDERVCDCVPSTKRP
jgi:hypothetical protein